MLASDRVSLALALVTTVAVGCGGSENADGTGGKGGSGGQGGGTSSSVSSSSAASSSGDGPVRAQLCPKGKGTTLAVNKLYFGEGNSGQWKKVGLNVDGLASTGASKDVCQPNAGGKAGIAYPDGDDGIDNSFGKNLLPLIIGLYPTWVSDINNSILNGVFTAMFKLTCLPEKGDAPNLTTKLFGATSLGMPPKFDGTDKWPVEPELLSNPMDPESSTILFKKSSVLGNAFDSGKNVTVILTVPISTQTQSTSIKLTVNAAQAIMTLSEDRKSATGGMIGGVLNTEEFVTEVKKVGALLSLCDSPLFANLVTQIRQASDIMDNGTQDPAQTCNGISIGLGFEMKEVQIGEVGPPTMMGASCQ